MKKITVFITVFLSIASSAFSSDFKPTVMTLAAPPVMQYGFTGNDLTIDVEVKGTPANLIFAVYTNGMAENINNIQNGFLGWHTVNKVDTCIYWSHGGYLAVGDASIKWDGTDLDGNPVISNEYTYYLWAYDSESSKILAAPNLISSWHNIIVQEHDPVTGDPLDRPFLMGDDTQDRSGGKDGYRGRWKWTIGNDPSLEDLMETTTYQMPWDGGERKTPAWSPYTPGNFYTMAHDGNANVMHIRQFSWVPNGESVQILDWGDGGEFTYSTDVGGFQVFAYVGSDILVCGNSNFASDNSLTSEMVLVDIVDGTETRRLDLARWWVNVDEGNAGGQDNGWPSQHDVQDGKLIMGAWTSCMHQMIDPAAGEDESDWNVWINGNGDFIGDHNFDEDSPSPWICNDFNVAPYMYSINLDSNMFSTFPCYDLGSVSFGLMGPDGTGIEYFAYAGETAGSKLCTEMINYDSPYDGIYTDNRSGLAGENTDNVWYVAYDSIKGLITPNATAVKEEGPEFFSVSQNTPNPFNPATTISYRLGFDSSVIIDIFNVAGQKVDTLIDAHQEAGNHSVIWDASSFSAGIYFCTVKTQTQSRTMKMTLVK